MSRFCQSCDDISKRTSMRCVRFTFLKTGELNAAVRLQDMQY